MDRLWILSAVISLVRASGNSSLTTATPNGTDYTSTSTSDPSSTSTSVIEIVIIGLGLILLLFVAIRMSTMVRQYNNAGPMSDLDTVDCAVCSFRQGIPRTANVFVCCSCHSANFIQRESGHVVRNFSPSPRASGRKVSLHKVTDTFFKVDSEHVAPGPDSTSQNHTSSEIPQTTGSAEGPSSHENVQVERKGIGSVSDDAAICTVCMDAEADTVMMPCAHGGICYKCADALVRKFLLLGGAKCIHCRHQIDSLVKLSDMDKDVAEGIEIEIPKAMIIIRPET